MTAIHPTSPRSLPSPAPKRRGTESALPPPEPTDLSLAFWRDGRAWPDPPNESSLLSHPPGTTATLASQRRHGGVQGAHVGILRLVLVSVIVLP